MRINGNLRDLITSQGQSADVLGTRGVMSERNKRNDTLAAKAAAGLMWRAAGPPRSQQRCGRRCCGKEGPITASGTFPRALLSVGGRLLGETRQPRLFLLFDSAGTPQPLSVFLNGPSEIGHFQIMVKMIAESKFGWPYFKNRLFSDNGATITLPLIPKKNKEANIDSWIFSMKHSKMDRFQTVTNDFHHDSWKPFR